METTTCLLVIGLSVQIFCRPYDATLCFPATIVSFDNNNPVTQIGHQCYVIYSLRVMCQDGRKMIENVAIRLQLKFWNFKIIIICWINFGYIFIGCFLYIYLRPDIFYSLSYDIWKKDVSVIWQWLKSTSANINQFCNEMCVVLL